MVVEAGPLSPPPIEIEKKLKLNQDLSSLRLLLPSAQKHLVPPGNDHLASSLAKLKVEDHDHDEDGDV